ncbi:MAG: D-alanyl-D-alanine carboxypeptidase [Epulopiscium sp.]|nr:D-alanyl-D-alanine carboxypeptidase [Candidatus Epulonipiscium sp.]
MKFMHTLCIIISFTLFLNLTTFANTIIPSYALPSDISPPEITSESAILMEAKTGTILYEKNIHQKLFPASITKILTTSLALEYGSLDQMVTFSDEAIFSIERNSSHLWMVPEEQITLEEALYGMMLQSANDVSNGVAESISGSIEKFVQLMNQKAQSLGAYNTHFTNPHGLHNEQHYTTAYDMALIAKEALQNQKFREIIQTPRYEIPPTNKNEIRYLHNQHYMLPGCTRNIKYVYEGCLGGKTGYTDQARHTLVTYAQKNGLELICVILKSDKPLMYDETTTLFDYGFNQFSLLKLANANTSFTSIPLKNSHDTIKTRIQEDIYAVVPKHIVKEKIQNMVVLPYQIQTSVQKGETLGYIDFSYQNNPIAKVNIISQDNYNFPVEKEIPSSMEVTSSQTLTTSFSFKRVIIMIIVLFLLLGGLFSLLSLLSTYQPMHKR